MARILILGVKVPYTSGGAEVLVRSLRRELRNRGHVVDVFELPLSLGGREDLLTQVTFFRQLDFQRWGAGVPDLVIATKFPSYYVQHPRKSVWLVHQHRPVYDLYGGRFSDFCDDPRDEALRQILVRGDCLSLGEAQYLSGISRNVVERLQHYNNLEGEVLYPPLPLGGKYRQGAQQDYMLSVGRLCHIKRVDMMIKALPIIHHFVKLKVVGVEDEPGVMEYFRNEIDKHHLWHRVEFLGRVSDEDLLDLYANALGVYYAPYNEDYGYVTLEAFASSKPVVTAKDSGGVLEFVQHGRNGLIVDPTIDAVGHAVNRLVENKAEAKKLGEQGYELIQELGLVDQGWEHLVERLLSPLNETAEPPQLEASAL